MNLYIYIHKLKILKINAFYTFFFFFNLYILEIGEEQTKKQKWEIKLIIISINTKTTTKNIILLNIQIFKFQNIDQLFILDMEDWNSKELIIYLFVYCK